MRKSTQIVEIICKTCGGDKAGPGHYGAATFLAAPPPQAQLGQVSLLARQQRDEMSL